MKTVLTVKNMVCDRCIKLVREQLQELGYKPASMVETKASTTASIAILVSKLAKPCM